MKQKKINVCPHCGNEHPRVRYYNFYKKPFSMHCDACGFYQDGATKLDAISAWNKATASTNIAVRVRIDKFKDRKVIDTLSLPNSPCANCQDRIELCGMAPTEYCLGCGHLSFRNAPYFVEVPVYEEEGAIMV